MAAKKTATKKNNKKAATKKSVKKAPTKKEKTLTVTINKKKVKVTQKRSSRYNAKGERVQKKCSLCGKWLDLDNYYRPEKDCRCKSCSSKYAAERREAEAA